MADDIVTQIRITADAGGVEAGATKAKRSLLDLGKSAEQAGEQGAKGLGKLAGGGDVAVQGLDRVTKNMVSNVRLQIAALESGGTATRQYQESLARLRGADTAALRPYLDQLEQAKTKAEAAARAQQGLETSVGTLGTAATYARTQLVALAASITLGGVLSFVKAVNDGVDALNDLKDATGSSIENISALEYVGRRTGASFDTVSSVLIKFNDVLSKATPKSDIALQLDAIGLSAQELKKLDPSEALRVTAVALSKFADDGNKARLIQDLFGKSVKEAAPFLADLAEQATLTAKATTQQGDAADRLNKQFFALQARSSELSRELVVRMVPGLTQISEAMVEGAKQGGILLGVYRGIAEFASIAFGTDKLGQATSRAKDAQAELLRLQRLMVGPELIAERDPQNEANNRRLQGLRTQIERVQKEALAATDALKALVNGPQAPASDDKPSVGTVKTAAEIAAAAAEAKRIAEEQKRAAADLNKVYAELAGLSASYYEDIERAKKARAEGNITEAQYVQLIGQIIQKQPFAVELAKKEADAHKELVKEVETLNKAYEAKVKAQQAAAKAVADQVVREEESIRMMGLTKEEVAEVTALKYLDLAASRERAAALEEEDYASSDMADALRLEANAYRNLAAAKREGAAKQAYLDVAAELKAVNDRAQQEWQRTIDNIDNVFRQGFADMLNGGEDAWSAFTKSLRTTFMTTVADEIYKAFARPFVVNIAANMLGSIGLGAGGFGSTGAGGGTNLLGLAQNASSLYSMYNNAGSYLQTAANWLGFGSGASAALGTYSLATGATGLGLSAAAGSTGLAGLVGSTAVGGTGGLYALGQGIGSGLGLSASGTAFGTLAAPTATATGAAVGGGAAAGLSASSVIPIVGWILAAIGASSSMYGKGYSIKGVEPVADLAITGGVTTANYKVLDAIGLSSKWADILSGGPILDKTLDFFGISRGERRYGGQYGYSAASDQIFNARRGTYVPGTAGTVTFLEGPSGGPFAEDDVKKLVTTTVEGINGIFKALESDARIADVWAGLEVSTADKGGVFFGGRDNKGRTFGETSFESTSTRSPNAQQAIQNLALDAQQATLQALQAATDLPKSISAYLKTLKPEDMTSEDIAQALTTIGQQAAVIKNFRDALQTLPFDNLRTLSYDTAEALITAAGGLDTLNSGLSSYFENYYSEAERLATQTSYVTKAITDLGLQMPDLASGSEAARAAFRALVDAQDVSTEQGRANYVALLGIQQAFAGLTPVVDETAAALRAAEEAARASQAALTERTRLEDQLLGLQGDTATLRQRDLDRLLNDENRAILRQIFELQDVQSAAAAAAAEQARAQAAFEASAAAAAASADQIRSTWQSLGDSLVDEIRRIQGAIVGEGAAGLDGAIARFSIATAQARAGDQEAAASLPELSRRVDELYVKNATSATDLALSRSRLAASLMDTDAVFGRKYGITVPAFETTARAAPTRFDPYLPVATASGATGADVAQLQAQITALQQNMDRMVKAGEQTADLLYTYTRGGKPGPSA